MSRPEPRPVLARIVVFDSGLGSLSIIRAIQGRTRCEVIYLADRKNFPYGEKTGAELSKIIGSTIETVRERFRPDLVVMGSNTPSVMLDPGRFPGVFRVLPPVRQAAGISRTGNVAVLATRSAVRSGALAEYIAKSGVPKGVKLHKINCSGLVGLVESGDFLDRRAVTAKTVRRILAGTFGDKKIDVATLSSTHLPFLMGYLREQFPDVTFVDPADGIAASIAKRIRPISRNRLRIYCTGSSPETFESNLRRLGVRNRVVSL